MESRVIVEDPTNENSGGGGLFWIFLNTWTVQTSKYWSCFSSFANLPNKSIHNCRNKVAFTVLLDENIGQKLSWVFFGLVKMHILAKCSSIRSRKWLFLIGGNYNDWPRWWELNSVSLCKLHLCRFIGKDGGDTKQCTQDVLRTYRGLPRGML
jgi:hypothetical protein